MSMHDTGSRSACLVLLVVLVCTGVPAVLANDGRMTSDPGMMERAEGRALDNATHEEMEELMEKWMDGTISPAEEDRLLELMEEHPGPSQMMWRRLDRDRYDGTGWGPGHMVGWDDGASAGMLLLMIGAVLLGAVWFIVGLLAILWLLRRLRAPG